MPTKSSASSRAKKIKLLLFDVDGVLTDGKLYIFPAPASIQQTTLDHPAKHGGQGGFGLVSQTLIEAKGFHAHDGTAISLARLGGIKTGERLRLATAEFIPRALEGRVAVLSAQRVNLDFGVSAAHCDD